MPSGFLVYPMSCQKDDKGCNEYIRTQLLKAKSKRSINGTRPAYAPLAAAAASLINIGFGRATDELFLPRNDVTKSEAAVAAAAKEELRFEMKGEPKEAKTRLSPLLLPDIFIMNR